MKITTKRIVLVQITFAATLISLPFLALLMLIVTGTKLHEYESSIPVEAPAFYSEALSHIGLKTTSTENNVEVVKEVQQKSAIQYYNSER